MKHSRSDKKDTIYVQAMLKRNKTVNSLPQTAADASPAKMKEEYIVDEIKLVTSATASKDKRTVMNRHIKEMASLCTIYDVSFKHLAEEHNLSVGEDQSGMVEFFLAELPYNVQRDPKEDHAAYDVFG